MATSFIELDVWAVVTVDKTVDPGSMAVASVWIGVDVVGILLGMAMDGSG